VRGIRREANYTMNIGQRYVFVMVSEISGSQGGVRSAGGLHVVLGAESRARG
jgi:hypothetical protein